MHRFLRTVLVLALLFATTAGLGLAQIPGDDRQPTDPGARLVDSVTIEFPDQVPASVRRTLVVPEGGADVLISARDCCIRDDVVEIYVNGCLLTVVDSRGGPRGSHIARTAAISLPAGTHTVEYRMVISGPGASAWEVDERQEGFTGCHPCRGNGRPQVPVLEHIDVLDTCLPSSSDQLLMAKWGRYGKRTSLRAENGDEMKLICSAGGLFKLRLSRFDGSSERTVGVCPWEGGCNFAFFSGMADGTEQERPACIVSTSWKSADLHDNDIPNPVVPGASESPELFDIANSFYTIYEGQPFGRMYRYSYQNSFSRIVNGRRQVFPFLSCGAFFRFRGQQQDVLSYSLSRYDSAEGSLIPGERGEPGAAGVLVTLNPCDLDGDGVCREADHALFQTLLGSCDGDLDFDALLDIDLDGCLTEDDAARLFALPIDLEPESVVNVVDLGREGRLTVAVLSTDFAGDATQLDVGRLSFGSSGHEALPEAHAFKDIDEDGDLDLVLLFRVGDTGLSCGETTAYLMMAGDALLEEAVLTSVATLVTVGCEP